MTRSDQGVETLIRKFASDLQGLIREQLSAEVTAAVQAALGGGGVRKGRGRAKASSARAAGAGAGGKRTPEQIEKLGLQLVSYIEKNPDQRSEQIADALKLTTAELALPLKRLVTEKKLRAKGKARGTTYTAVK